MIPMKFFLGALVGFAAGAALGVLFAPDKGTETRKKILRRSEALTDAVTSTIDNKFDDLVSTISSKVKNRKVQNDSLLNKNEFVG